MKDFNLSVVRGACQILTRHNLLAFIQASGCTAGDINLVRGSTPWVGSDRPRVVRVIDAIVFGVLDMIGVPRFEVPSEYLASTIALYVHPCNYFVACAWLGISRRAEDVLVQPDTGLQDGIEPVTPSQLFTLVCQVASDDRLAGFDTVLQEKVAQQFKGGLSDE